MKTALVTGGTDGIGKGVAMQLLKKGFHVFVVGSSSIKGERIIEESKELNLSENLTFLQANLSLVKENKRIIEVVKKRTNSLNIMVFCATSQKYQETYSDTEEGFEFNFALSYLSRHILSYGLKDIMENAENPVILNVCAPGMKGKIDFDDIENKKNFKSLKTMYHSSRLNDLLGVAFNQRNTSKKVKYILYNPWAVQTNGAFEAYKNPVVKNIMKIIYSITGKPVEEAIKPILRLLENPPEPTLSAYKVEKEISLEMETFDKRNAEKLYDITDTKLTSFSV